MGASGLDLEGLRAVGVLRLPGGVVCEEAGGGFVVFKDAAGVTVAVVQQPKRIGCTGDVGRCCDELVVDVGGVWWEGFVPFRCSRVGLEVLATIAVATGGRMLVKGVRE